MTDGRGGDIFQGRCAASPGRTDPGDRGFPSGQIPQIPATLLLVKHASAGGFCWGSYRQRDPARVRAALEELPRWHGQGEKQAAGLRGAAAHAGQALERLFLRQSSGKIVLTFDDR